MSVSIQTPADVASDFATLSFVVQQLLSTVQTLTLVRIVDCTNDGGIVPVGTVTVQPLVNMMSGDRVAFKHKPLYKLPYLRVQGGKSAVILDPKPGDIGLAGFCSRDISSVKASQAEANPGSFRQFSMADGVYLYTCMGSENPDQYVMLKDGGGIKVLSPTEITLEAPTINLKGEVVQTDGDASFGQNVTVSQNVDVGDSLTAVTEVTAAGIGLTTHKHIGVTPGGGTSGTPVP